MLGNQMFPAALSVFMVVLVKGLNFPPVLWGILMFVPRILDAVTDPIMGFITDNTRSRWGRRRPYIFLGAIITGLTYIASAGLGALMGVIDEIRSHGGDLRLSELSETVVNILEILGLHHLYQIFPSELEAIASFQDGREATR